MVKALRALVFTAAGVLAAGAVQAAGNAAEGAGKAAVCAGCHGNDGNSAVPAFPKLAGQGERYLIKQIKDHQSGARPIPEMTGMTENLSDQDIADIAAHFASKTQTGGAADPALVEAGKKMFKAGNAAKGIPSCIGCHGPAGKGMKAAGFPSLAGQHFEYIKGQLVKFRSEERNNDESRMMRDIAANMSDREIEAVSSYISGLY